MTTPADVRCSAAAAGNVDAATRIDLERCWRWIIALLQAEHTVPDGQDPAALIQQEVGDCPHCLRAVASGLAGIAAGIMRARHSRWVALLAAQHSLDEVLSTPDVTAADPPPV